MRNRYIKVEDGKIRQCPMNDFDGSITGKIVYNVSAYFDEHPEEARRLGWVKHIKREPKEVKRIVDWDPRSQYVITTLKWIDEWTVEDEYHVMNKSEEMMLREELSGATTAGGIAFFDGDWEGTYEI